MPEKTTITTIPFSRNSVFVTSSRKYSLKEDISLKCVDHRGAYATLLVEHPLNKGHYVRYGPALEDADRLTEAQDLINTLAARYHFLTQTSQKLTRADTNERDHLAQLFEPLSN